MSIAPFLPTPFSDFGYYICPMFNLAYPNTLCYKIQLKYLDCLEAYGVRKGREKCKELLYDLSECTSNAFQRKRAMAIREERMKQYREGKLKVPFPERPPLDSYYYM